MQLRMKKIFYTLLSVTLMILVLSLLGCTSVSTSNTSDYGEFLDGKYSLNTVAGFYPEDLERVSAVKKYFFEYNVGFLDDEAQVILDCVYTPEQYGKEIERIKALNYSYSYYPADENSIFQYPAYAMSVKQDCYEYVLLIEEEHRMVYIHLEYYPSDSVQFDKSFLPKGYEW